MTIRIDPVFSPYLTTRTGPNGEQAELLLADLRVSFVEPRADGDVTYVEHDPRDIAKDGFFFSAEVHPIDL